MKPFSFLLFLSVIAIILTSCKKEEDLTVDKAIAANQQSGIDFLNAGGDPDLGGNTSTSVNEFLEATVDGVRKTYSTFSYVESGNLMSMSGFDNSSAISFSLFGLPVSGDKIDLADPFEGRGSYVPGVGQNFSSSFGELNIDTATADFLSGTFYFRAINDQNANDSIIVSNGKFKIAK